MFWARQNSGRVHVPDSLFNMRRNGYQVQLRGLLFCETATCTFYASRGAKSHLQCMFSLVPVESAARFFLRGLTFVNAMAIGAVNLRSFDSFAFSRSRVF